MLTALFIILMFAVFGKLILFAFKASWGILKVLLTIIIFPLLFDRVICFRTGLYCTDTACNRRNCVGGQIIDVKITIADVRHMLPDVHSVCRLLPESGLQPIYILRWQDVSCAPSWKTIP